MLTSKQIIENLWNIYIKQPHIKKIYDLFIAREGSIEHDHIALRTFQHPKVDIDVLSKPFVADGYRPIKEYFIADRHIHSVHFEHENGEFPRLFINELELNAFSPCLQSLLTSHIEKIPQAIINTGEFIFSGTHWGPLSHSTYQELLEESQYASWMYAFGFYISHFAMNINAFKHFNEISDVNTFLKQHNHPLNNIGVGGEIQGTSADHLVQSSTLAGKIAIEFIEGTFDIPSSYYEFVKRYPMPNGKLFSAFNPNVAGNFFNSTDNFDPEKMPATV